MKARPSAEKIQLDLSSESHQLHLWMDGDSVLFISFYLTQVLSHSIPILPSEAIEVFIKMWEKRSGLHLPPSPSSDTELQSRV